MQNVLPLVISANNSSVSQISSRTLSALSTSFLWKNLINQIVICATDRSSLSMTLMEMRLFGTFFIISRLSQISGLSSARDGELFSFGGGSETGGDCVISCCQDCETEIICGLCYKLFKNRNSCKCVEVVGKKQGIHISDFTLFFNILIIKRWRCRKSFYKCHHQWTCIAIYKIPKDCPRWQP